MTVIGDGDDDDDDDGCEGVTERMSGDLVLYLSMHTVHCTSVTVLFHNISIKHK